MSNWINKTYSNVQKLLIRYSSVEADVAAEKVIPDMNFNFRRSPALCGQMKLSEMLARPQRPQPPSSIKRKKPEASPSIKGKEREGDMHIFT